MSFKDYSGSTTYWSTLSVEMLRLVFNEWIAPKIFKRFAPGRDDVVWLQKHPKHKCGVGIVYHQSNTKEFKILVCRTSNMQKLKGLHNEYYKLLTDFDLLSSMVESNPDLFEELLERIADKVSMLICLGSVKGTSTEGKGKGELSVGQFIDKIFPNKFAPFRLKGPVPDMPGGGTSSMAYVTLELESRYIKDDKGPSKDASSEDINSWKTIKGKEEAAALDLPAGGMTQMKLRQHFGREPRP